MSSEFRESAERKVVLSSEDNPETFSILRDYLYCKQIDFSRLKLPHLLNVIHSAHRWSLLPLFAAVCNHVCMADIIQDGGDVIAAAGAVELPDVPDKYRRHFWNKAARCFDDFTVENALTKWLQKDEDFDVVTTTEVGDEDEASERDDNGSEEIAEDEEGISYDSDDALVIMDEAEQEMAEISSVMEEGSPNPDDNDSVEGNPVEAEEKKEEVRYKTVVTLQKACLTEGEAFVRAVHAVTSITRAEADEDGGEESTPTEEDALLRMLTPRFPHIWQLAISHGVIASFISRIVRRWAYSGRNLRACLLVMVMRVLEPFITSENVVGTIFDVLIDSTMGVESLLRSAVFAEGCSVRAMRLFANSMLTSRQARFEATSSWGVNIYGVQPGSRGKRFYRYFSFSRARSHTDLEFEASTTVFYSGMIRFILSWEMGKRFSRRANRVDVGLAVLDEMEGRSRGRMAETNMILFERNFEVKLNDGEDSFVHDIGEDVVGEFRMRHEDCRRSSGSTSEDGCDHMPIFRVLLRLLD